jgi:hypothetical protein
MLGDGSFTGPDVCQRKLLRYLALPDMFEVQCMVTFRCAEMRVDPPWQVIGRASRSGRAESRVLLRHERAPSVDGMQDMCSICWLTCVPTCSMGLLADLGVYFG